MFEPPDSVLVRGDRQQHVLKALPATLPTCRGDVGGGRYAGGMSTRVESVTEEELLARRAAILKELGLTSAELDAKVSSGGLVGHEWSAWSEIEDIDYLLGRD